MDTWTLTHSPLPQPHETELLPQEIEVEMREDRVRPHEIGAGHDPIDTLAIFCSHLSGPWYHFLNFFSYAFSGSDHTDPQVSFLWFFHCTSP